MVTGAASLLLLASAGSIPLLVLAWAPTQLAFNILPAGLNPVAAQRLHRTHMIDGGRCRTTSGGLWATTGG
ncbi:hypothetical protein ACWEV3_32555 [Saccharopolyspora sp. NPDC003752]